MTTLNISLPNNLREWIDARIKKGDYTSASDYLRDLIRHDQEKHIIFDGMLLEGIDSGEAVEATGSFWKDKREQLKQRLHAKK